jgi:HK97 family phage major capsid protein
MSSNALKVPRDATEFAEFLATGGAKNFDSREDFAAFLTKYTRQVAADDPDIQQQIKEQSAATLVDFLQHNREAGYRPVTLSPAATGPWGPANRAQVYNKFAPGASLDDTYGRDPARFFRAVWHNSTPTREIFDDRINIKNAFSSDVPSEGGFLIPEILRADLLRVALETAIVRSRARVVPMASLRLPYPAIDDVTHVSSVYGGIVGYWTEEGAPLTDSSPAFGRIILDAKKLTAYTSVPNELIQDSIVSLNQFMSEIFPEALAWYEDDGFLNGTGNGSPLGVLNGTAAITVPRNTLNQVLFADIVNMYPRMLPASLNRAVWLISPQVIAQLLQLVLVSGSTPVAPPLWLTGFNAQTGPQWQLLGQPVIVSEKIPALGSAGDVAFVDFGYYLIGDRQQMTAASSPHIKFNQDMTAFRFVERVDGQPWLRSAITPRNGGSTLSPIVLLKATTT